MFELKVELKEHQQELVEWWKQKLYENNLNGNILIADEQGLGKTVESLAVVSELVRMEEITKGWGLVITPNSLKSNWKQEIIDKVDGLNPIVVNNNAQLKTLHTAVDNGLWNVVIINYEKIPKLLELGVIDKPPTFIILDESHFIKSRSSKRYKAIKELIETKFGIPLSHSKHTLQKWYNQLREYEPPTKEDEIFKEWILAKLRNHLINPKQYRTIFDVADKTKLQLGVIPNHILKYILDCCPNLILNQYVAVKHKLENGITIKPTGVRLVIELTGTPFANDIGELWTQLYLLGYWKYFGSSWASFCNKYSQTTIKDIGKTFIEVVLPPTPNNLQKLTYDLKSTCLIRRTKQDIKSKLGLKDKHIQILPITAFQNVMLYFALFSIPLNLEVASKLTLNHLKNTFHTNDYQSIGSQIMALIQKINADVQKPFEVYQKLEAYLDNPTKWKEDYEKITFKNEQVKDLVELMKEYFYKDFGDLDTLQQLGVSPTHKFIGYAINLAYYLNYYLYKVYRFELKELFGTYTSGNITYQEFKSSAVRLINRLRQISSILRLPFTTGLALEVQGFNSETYKKQLMDKYGNVELTEVGRSYLKQYLNWLFNVLFEPNSKFYKYKYKWGDFDKPLWNFIHQLGVKIKSAVGYPQLLEKNLTDKELIEKVVEVGRILFKTTLETYIPLKEKTTQNFLKYMFICCVNVLETQRTGFINYIIQQTPDHKLKPTLQYWIDRFVNQNPFQPTTQKEKEVINTILEGIKSFKLKGGLPVGGITYPQPPIDKLIIFTNFVLIYKLLNHIFNFINQYFNWENTIFYLDSKTPPQLRTQVVNQFNNHQGKAILLSSLKVGNVGLNIVGGKSIIFQDFHFNPQEMQQGEDRIYRIGQTDNVFIYYPFLITTSIEIPIFITIIDKLQQYFAIIDENQFAVQRSKSSNYLKQLISFI